MRLENQIKSQIKKVERIKKNMISKLKIALLQIAPCKTLEENLEKGIVCCRKAKERGADIALFPEMWSNGYNIYGRHFDEWKAEAISVDSDFINTFGETAKELDMAVGITLLEKYENAPRNSLVLFDRFGKKKFVYAKESTLNFYRNAGYNSSDKIAFIQWI